MRRTVCVWKNRNYRNWRGVKRVPAQVMPYEKQMEGARRQSVSRVMQSKPYLNREATFTRMFHRNRRWRGEVYPAAEDHGNEHRTHADSLYALQGLGDLEPLSSARDFGVTERERMTHSPSDLAVSKQPPCPYTPLMARKLARGEWWPSAPTVADGVHVTRLRHEDDMSPSARTFSDKVLYLIRRNLKGCPGDLADTLDFREIIIERVIASNRSRHLHIVWSTVDPAARVRVEPFITRLDRWVRRLIKRYVKTIPNIPKIYWVYNTGALPTALPKHMVRELQSLSDNMSFDVQDRIKEIKKMDSLSHRLRGVQWFMPYLWAKDDRAANEKAMVADLEEYKKRVEKGASEPPRYVQ